MWQRHLAWGLLLLASRALGAAPFGPEVLASGTGPQGVLDVAVADVNGDGLPDVLTASTLDDAFVWHENVTGSGRDWRAHPIAGPPLDPSAIAAADLDGDGDLDVIGASAGDGKIRWFENTAAQPQAWPQHAIAGDAAGVARIAVADLNRDGRPDVVAAVRFAHQVVWYAHPGGNGTGPWAAEVIAGDFAGAASVRVGDLDSDGNPDVAAVAFDGDRLAAWLNRAGTGREWLAVPISDALDGPTELVLGDFDGDAKLDVAASASFNQRLSWFANTGGNGTAWAERAISTNRPTPQGMVTGDFNHDGRMDLAGALTGANSLAWYANPGAAEGAWAPRTISNQVAGASCLAVAHFSRPQAFDLIGGAFAAGQVALYFNAEAPGTVWNESIIAGRSRGAQGIAAGDLDNNGLADFAVASFKDNKIAWLQARGLDGTLWQERVLTRNAPGAATVAIADLDGNRQRDVIAGSFTDDAIRIFSNVAQGERFTSRTITTAVDGVSKVVVADVNGDGRPDVLSASRNDNKLAWFENRPAGDWPQRVISTALAEADSLAAAQVDGTGGIDVVGAAFGGDKLTLFRNTAGDGRSWTPVDVATGLDGVAEVALADLDADGDTDVAATIYNAGDVLWFENTAANGTAWQRHDWANLQAQAAPLVLGDVDLTGGPDAVYGTFAANRIVLLRNLGGRLFGTEPLPEPYPGPTSLALGDVDGDGDLDLGAALYQGDRVGVFVNGTRQRTAVRDWWGYR